MNQIDTSQTFNTNIKDYSIDDIFNLLDIQIENLDDQCDLTNNINEKIDKYVSVFTRLNNNTMVQFFQDIRNSLLNNDAEDNTENITESQQLLQILQIQQIVIYLIVWVAQEIQLIVKQ